MFGFVKKVFVSAIMFFGCNLSNVNSLTFVLMSNQESEINPEIVNINIDEPTFYLYCVKINKCGGSCNSINGPYAKMCIPDVVIDINIKVFNLVSKTNETRYIKFHETWKCKCRLDASDGNSKQCWNEDKCRCECEELIDKGNCEKGFIWNPSNSECQCDKSCDVGEYLDYENCKCRKKLVDKLVDECTENIDGAKLAKITLAEYENRYENECKSFCTLYIVLLSIIFTINIGIGTFLIYYKYMNHDKKQLLKQVLFFRQQFIKHINEKYQTNKH